MKKNRKTIIIAALLAFCMLMQSSAAFAAGPGAAPGGSAPGSSSSASASYSGASTISSSSTASGQSYSSTTAGQNALLVSGGSSTLSGATVTKSGSPSGSSDDYDFYGTNAAVLVYNGATLNISGSTVNTDASYASGVFAYGTGVVNISDSTIKTTGRNSGGVMVTGGGTLTANDLTVTTSGNSSAAIRSDRGGGTLTVNGGSYSTSGTGSPVIYSTADISVNDAVLTATASEGVVIEGKNSVTLNGVTLTDTNNTLNGNSETYKNIFLYQSMSGDASVGTSSFEATDCTITTNKGDTIFVTNTDAVVELSNNKIVNNDSTGVFLRAQAGKWGTSGSNGGNVTLSLDDQEVSGDIVIDSVSTLSMSLSNGSEMTGTINGSNSAKSISLTLDSSSSITLTGDSYVTSLSNADSSNSNIHLNGYTLYVNGTAVSADNSKAASSENTDSAETAKTSFSDVRSGSYYYDAVQWAVENSITSGLTATSFGPGNSCTRAQIVTFLWKCAGSPVVSSTRSFSDVAKGSYYYNAVQWAVANGITSGTSEDCFSPNAVCTRAQAMTFLWRAAGSPKASSAKQFADVSEGSYYYNAVQWAVANGITSGVNATSFGSDQSCTRAQIVTFLYKYSKL